MIFYELKIKAIENELKALGLWPDASETDEGRAQSARLSFEGWVRGGLLEPFRTFLGETSYRTAIPHLGPMARHALARKPAAAALWQSLEEFGAALEADGNPPRRLDRADLPGLSAPAPERLRSLLDEMEKEMRTIGYWTEAAGAERCLDSQFMAPDRYFQFAFLPQERRRKIVKGAKAEVDMSIPGFAHLLTRVPKARRLAELVALYMAERSAVLGEPFNAEDYRYAPTEKTVWLLEASAHWVRKEIGRVVDRMGPQLKLPGFKRGAAPTESLVKAHWERIETEVVNLVLFREAPRIGVEGGDDGVEALCCVDRLRDGEKLEAFLLAGKPDLGERLDPSAGLTVRPL